VVLLLLSVAVAGVVAVHAHRTQRSHRATAEALLRDYGTFAAWSFGNRWGELLAGSLGQTLSNAMGAAQRQRATEECLQTLLLVRPEGECACGTSLAGPASWAFLATLGPGKARAVYQGPSPSPAVREQIVGELEADARRTYRSSGHRFRMRWVEGGSTASRLMAFAVVPALSGDTVIYGIEVDPDRYLETLRRAMEAPNLLPPTLQRGRASGDILAVQYVRDDGRLVFESRPGAELRIPGEQAVQGTGMGGVVRAAVLPAAAEDLIIGGLPSTRVPYLLFLFGLSAALALLAVFQLRKENAFARERQDFVAGVSHELRTPLAQIRLFVETLRLGRTRNDDEREWALGTIDRETLRLTRLVENILHFSRAERGRLADLDREPADLAAETEAVVASFRPLLRPAQAEIEVDAPPGLQAELHRDGFRQVLLNLLDNAVKYGPEGQTVRVTARGRDGTVLLAVEDEGPGIPEGERRAVFEPFRRGRDSLGGVVTGSGIGLSVVREIVAAHDGRVRVEDPEGGRGARFVVEVPRLRTVPDERLRRPPEVPDAAAGAA
jgi:signal transduction histidine kinase